MAEQFPAAAGRRIRSSKADGGSLAASSLTSKFTDSISVRLGSGPGETKNWRVASLGEPYRSHAGTFRLSKTCTDQQVLKVFIAGGPKASMVQRFYCKTYPSERPQTGWGSRRRMYDNV